MSDLERKVDEVINRLVEECPDPRARRYREEFRQAEAEARDRFERWQRETLDERRRYHALCGLDKKAADAEARHDLMLLSIDVKEELDRLICHHWQRFTERLSRLLEEVENEDQ